MTPVLGGRIEPWVLGGLIPVAGVETSGDEVLELEEMLFILPGNQILTKQLQVPHVDPAKQRQIIAVDAQPWKFNLAQKLGATHCVDASDVDPVAAVQEITGGGADFVFECIGLVPTVQQAVAMTGRGGTSVLVGVVPITEMVQISAADLTLQEKNVTGSFMGSNRFRFDMPKYIDFYLDGRLHLDEMISSRLPLAEVNDAFDRMRKGEAARQVIVYE